MIIHQPEITHHNGEVEISARIEFQQTVPHVPDRLWFRYPESCEKYLTTRGDGFLLNMLIPAMHYGEDIEVRAEVSPKLLYNLPEYQFLYAQKYRVSEVAIRCQEIQAFAPKTDPQAVLLTYSGGVDSMFTLWSHLPENQPLPSMQATHGLLVHGFNAFDIPLENPAYFEFVHKKYQQQFNDLGLPLLYVKTNVHDFSKFRISWTLAHGAVLSGTVHLLAGLVKTYIKGETGGYRYLEPNARTPHGEGLPLLSTETVDVVYFARRYSRDQKLKALAEWKHAHDNLRVCLNWQKRPDQLNCSSCRKCFSTMIMLALLGEYEKFKVFKQPFPRFAFKEWLGQFTTIELNLTICRTLAFKEKRYGLGFYFWLINYVRLVYKKALSMFNRYLSDEAKYKIRAKFYNSPQVGKNT